MISIGARFGTIRARLTLWNILVLLLLLVALGIALQAALRANLVRREDDGLSARGRSLIAQLPALTGSHRLIFLRRLRDSQINSADSVLGDDLVDATLDIDDADAPRTVASPRQRATTSTHEPSATPPPLLRPVGPAGKRAATDADGAATTYPVRLLRPDGSLLLSGLPEQAYDADALAAAIARGRELFTTVPYGGGVGGSDTVRVYTMPLRKDDGGSAALQLAVSEQPIQRQAAELNEALLLLIPVALLLAGSGAAFLSDRALRPVKAIQSAAAAIGGGGDLSLRLPVREKGRDEIAALEVTINNMLARIEAAFQQQQRFTADASHELRTPLAIAKTGIEVALLAQDRTPEEYRRALTGVGENLNRMSRMVDDLLLLARADAGHLAAAHEPILIGDLFLDAVEQVAPLFSEDGSTGPILQIIPSESPSLATVGDAVSLARLLRNLLENAERYTPDGGEVTLSATAVDASRLRIEVADTGSGIAPEHLPHVTERFYRVDSSRAREGGNGGSGLGLALCREIALAHGGDLHIESVPGEGTNVSVFLPRRTAAAENA